MAHTDYRSVCRDCVNCIKLLGRAEGMFARNTYNDGTVSQ